MFRNSDKVGYFCLFLALQPRAINFLLTRLRTGKRYDAPANHKVPLATMAMISAIRNKVGLASAHTEGTPSICEADGEEEDSTDRESSTDDRIQSKSSSTSESLVDFGDYDDNDLINVIRDLGSETSSNNSMATIRGNSISLSFSKFYRRSSTDPVVAPANFNPTHPHAADSPAAINKQESVESTSSAASPDNPATASSDHFGVGSHAIDP